MTGIIVLSNIVNCHYRSADDIIVPYDIILEDVSFTEHLQELSTYQFLKHELDFNETLPMDKV